MGLSATFAKVVDNIDETGQGRISVIINDVNPSNVFTAKPIFFSIGGWEDIEDSRAHRGSYLVPPVGAVVLVFFSHENPTDVYYMGSILPMDNFDKPALPESSFPEAHKRVVLARTESGQSIVLSEANVDKGVRITGFKRKYKRKDPNPSVLEKEGNQSIMEIDGKTGDILIYSLGDITLKTDGGFIKITRNGELIVKMSKSYTLEVPKTTERTNATRTGCRCYGHAETATCCLCCP